MRSKHLVLVRLHVLLFAALLVIAEALPAAQAKPSAIKQLEDGLNAYRSKDYDAAIEKLKGAVSSDPKLLAARFWLGMCYYLKGDLDAAEEQWKTVLAKKPNSTETRKWLAKLRAERARKMLFPAGYEEALNAYRQKRYEDAVRQLQAVASANPKFLPAFFWLGVVHLHLGNSEEALKAFSNVLQKRRSSVETMVWLGRLEEDSGRWEEALGWYRGALNINPKHKEAREQYKRLLGIVLAKYKGGVSALARGEHERALEELGEVAPRMRWWHEIQFWYARALIANGKYDDAIKLLYGVLQHRPNWTSAIYWLAEAYQGNGDVDGAASVLAMALRSNPNQPELRRKLMQLAKEHPQSVRLIGVSKRRSNSPSSLVTFINRCPDEIEVQFGEHEIKLYSGAQHTIELSPAIYRYVAKRTNGLAISGSLLILGWHNYTIELAPSPSSVALLQARSDMIESLSSQRFTKLTVVNASTFKVTMRLDFRFITLEPKKGATILVEPGSTTYAVCVHMSNDFAPGAYGEMVLPEWRSLRLTIR
ncbi:MAG: tetratricopeptide repeat protein [Armatimonadota bacterium]|nr:tetratricopeptide repeat protein [Armatimonadota bacterium]MCX7777509.1 tetratricopeptide repeat protein [Armatimonadota bacterium]MDW8025985.1 tetratricopeptide repeat protein [Armatimonadota bacterium]